MIKIYQLNFEGEKTHIGTIQGGKAKMTEDNKKFIIENYQTISRQEIAHQIGCSKTIIDRFMCENKLKSKKPRKKSLGSFPEHAEYVKKNHKTKSIREISAVVGYSEETVKEYIAIHHSKEDEAMKELRADLKNYYVYIKNLFDNNKVVAGRVNINFKELMALARLKKEGLIKLVKEKTGQYTVILN